jgi:O-antigen/teichoic acid export membrane protein
VKLLRYRLFTNAVANYAGQFTIVAVGILLTPFIIAHLGVDMYGVWALVVSIQGLGGLFDLGLSTSIVKYVAEHHARGEEDQINRVVSSSFMLHLGIGVLAMVATLLGAWLGLPLLNLDSGQLEIARVALVVAGATLSVGLPLGVPGNLLLGLRHYGISNGVNIVQTLIAAVAIVVALRTGGGPVALVAINGVGLTASHIARWFFAARLMPRLRVSPRLAGMDTLKRIGSYSVWLFLLDTAKRIFYNADAVLVAAFLPVGQVTAYNLGFKPASAISYLSGPMVSVFMPAASQMDARARTADLHRLLVSGTRVALALTLAGALWLLVFGRQIMEVWIGPGHEDALPVMYLFIGVFLVTAAQNPSGAILRGIGQVRTYSITVMLEYAANIAISVLLIPRIGVAGAALGTLIPAAVNDLMVIPWLASRALRLNYWSFLRGGVVGPVAAAVPALLLLWPLSMWLTEVSLLAIGIGGAATVLLFGVFYLLVGAGSEERTALREALDTVLRRTERNEEHGPTAEHIDTHAEQARPARPDSRQP